MNKRISFQLIRFFLALFLIFVLLEVGLRLIGFDYPQLPQRSFIVKPDEPFFIPHERYGFAMSPGKFEINQDDQLKWTSTQNENGYRITSDVSDTARPEIWIFGCSFTYGWGVDDDETYPWLLQEALPEYTIKNYGVGAYGTLQSYYQLKDELEKGKKPELIVLAYLPFHDQRNTASRFWIRAISTHKKLLNLQYPYARLEKDSLKYAYTTLSYQSVPGSSWSCASGFMEVMYNKWQDRSCKNSHVTRHLLKQISDDCTNANIPLVLCGLDSYPRAVDHLEKMNSSGLETLNIGLDLVSPEYTFLPVDPHPNQVAHRYYAKELTDFLKANEHHK